LGYYFGKYDAGVAITFDITATFDGDYRVYAFAFDGNPKKSAQVSSLVYFDISVKITTVKVWAGILGVDILVLLGVFWVALL
jgi:hypothetical protein